MIGSFGDVVFVASSEAIRTFEDFKRNTAARWAVHDIYLKNPKSQYVGPGQDNITFSMRFDVRYGMNPRKEMEKLLDMCRTGKVETLIIGGKGLGVNKWYIESINQEWVATDGQGRVLIGIVDVTLKEYV